MPEVIVVDKWIVFISSEWIILTPSIRSCFSCGKRYFRTESYNRKYCKRRTFCSERYDANWIFSMHFNLKRSFKNTVLHIIVWNCSISFYHLLLLPINGNCFFCSRRDRCVYETIIRHRVFFNWVVTSRFTPLRLVLVIHLIVIQCGLLHAIL